MKNETLPLRILVVDDDALSRDVIALLLEHAGFVVVTADSGDEAMHYLDNTPGPAPAVVLADIQMPGTSGSSLAHALRDCCGAGTRLLAMSGSSPSEQVVRGFDALLLKPFTIEELTAAIAGTHHSATVAGKSIHEDLTILNENIYERLAASMRRERLQQLYALCLDDIKERIGRMRQTASDIDDATFRREAHAIHGGAGMVGAIELQTLASIMEENGNANHVASLDEFINAWERLRRILMARKII
ncbi:response regulator [Edaphobacter paludis]|uniref:Response regulator n=1 Tax=Edaphobacter paludis TaxID=3035702 RepID=A0AAU7D099_9BACT